MAREHQLDEDRFRTILPEEVVWQPFPAFPGGARLAVVVGYPAEPAPYVVRVKVSGDTKLMPHKHPEDRVYTVISGVFYIGLGETFDGEKVKAYPPGSLIVLPGETWHFHWAKAGEYITQVSAIGPLGLDYRHLRDDPRRDSETEKESEIKGTIHYCERNDLSPELIQVPDRSQTGLARYNAKRVAQYIETNLDGVIRISDLAAVSRLSEGHFSKAFKTTFGQTPHTYIVARRLARAKDLMMESGMPLSFIAADCGFSDQAHMCRQFRRAHGASPGAWRRNTNVELPRVPLSTISASQI